MSEKEIWEFVVLVWFSNMVVLFPVTIVVAIIGLVVKVCRSISVRRKKR